MARSSGTGVRAKRDVGRGPRSAARGKPRSPASRTGSKDAEKQRQAVERAAEKFFASHGYRGTTMRDVADKAGCSVGQIYNLYPDKLELYRAIIESKCCLVSGMARQTLDSSLAPEERLRRMVHVLLGFFQKHLSFFRIVALETGPLLIRGNRHFLDCVDQWRAEMLGRITDAIRQGQQRGEFRPDLDAQLAAVSLFSLLKGHTGDWILHTGGSLVDRADAILDLYFAGMRRGRNS